MRENNVLKTENVILRTNVDAMKNEVTQLQANNDKQKDEFIQQKDEIGELTVVLDKMAVNNDSQLQHINSQDNVIAQLKAENKKLKKDYQELKVSL